METIVVNGKTYYSEPHYSEDIKGDLKIVVLQRGWVMIGYFNREGDNCTLSRASVIRNWGTKKGLGELAKEGARSETVLDKTNGLVEFHILTVVCMIAANKDKWSSSL